MSDEAPATSRLLLLLVVPPLLVGILVFTILSAEFSHRSADQQQRYGKATADQLSGFLAQYVVEGDVLSLNVVTAELINGGQVHFVAVYDDTNTLIAQSGRDNNRFTSFTSDITFQDSVVGFVRVAIPKTQSASRWWLSVPGTVLLFALAIVWRKPDLVTLWLYPKVAEETQREEQPDIAIDETNPEGFEECILVVRVRPAHYLERYFDKFFSAAELYRGIVEQTTPEELVIHFEGPDAVFMATSTGLLIRELTELMQGNMSFGGTLDLISQEPEKTRKAASYLASIAEGDLIMAGGEALVQDRVELQTFHHSLVDSQDLRRITQVPNQTILVDQAKQLVAG
ncbi:MAG: hypothetical protein HOC70_12365 [Gammaproteobacteria bacterium]|jgi:hypothetical protein|nr:hypothetical protein [Gammaproteobacteria bacterium]MBT4494029.1 hypothetical protein [Gammaproteobacteria bacterium]MBT7370857.1 hypothetical protein [Gammaproteobacteria bacterium]